MVMHNQGEPEAAVCRCRLGCVILASPTLKSSTRIWDDPQPARRRAVGSSAWWRKVCLGRVGAVAAREVSRFARNSREWQQLVEVCRVVDTVLIDQETVYAPRASNDRLLLGLKGSLNEYELDLLRQRSLEARRAMAKRGELIVIAPVGSQED